MSSSIKPIPNLIQGVSQQAAEQRRDSQCEAQFDCLNSAADGVDARPPTIFKKLLAMNMDGAFFIETTHEDENYVIGINNDGSPFAIDLADGTLCTITNTAGNSYQSYGAQLPADKLRGQVVEDTTFIINRNVRPFMTGTVSPTRWPEALVFVSGAQFDADLWMYLEPGGHAFKVETSTDDRTFATASYIAKEFETHINGTTDYEVERAGSSLRIYRGDGTDFTIEVDDGEGDTIMDAFKGKVSGFSKLPAKGFNGMVMKVSGESRTTADDYYVQFQGPPSTGAWVEVIGPGVHTTINPTSMPHTLVCTGYRQFEWKVQNWSTRIAGDEETAKDPSFIGKRIRDVFYDNNRLGILNEAGCTWSKLQFPFTFYPDTLQTVLSTAPIDTKLVAANNQRGAGLMDFAVQVDDATFLWAQKTQFRVTSGNEVFKQESIEAKPNTAYEYNDKADPVAVGTYLYFVTEAGSWSTVRTIQYQQGKALGDTDITAHIPKYIPSGIRGIVSSDTLRLMFLYGTTANFQVYNYLINDQEAIQSAWNTWRLPGGKILWASIMSDELRILQQRPEGVAYLSVKLNSAVVDFPGAGYFTRLDNRVDSEVISVPVSYNSTTDESTLTLPYTPTGADIRVITKRDKAGGYTRGHGWKITFVGGTTVRVEGDLTGYAFYVGQAIRASRTESQFFDRSDKGPRPLDQHSIESFQLGFDYTGYTRVEVKTPNKPIRKVEWEGRRLGEASAVTETVIPSRGTLTVPVGELTKDVTITMINDSALPSRWLSANYEHTGVGRGGIKDTNGR